MVFLISGNCCNIADMVILKALQVAITSGGHATRISGIENQGVKESLKDWEPEYWQEIFDYWQETINILLQMLERGEEQKKEAINIIGGSISHLIRFNQIDMLSTTIQKVVDINGNYWSSALDSINNAYQYQEKYISKKGMEALKSWKELLNPNESDLSTKLRFFVINPSTDFIEKDGHYIDLTTNKAKKFASEVVSDLDSFIALLPLLLESDQVKGYVFGEQLAQDVDDYSPLIKKTLSSIKILDNPNMSFCLGLFHGIYKQSEEAWLSYIENIKKDEDLVTYYPDFITTGGVTKLHLDNLLELTQSDVLLTSHSSILSYGGRANNISPSILSEFCLTLSQINNMGTWTALSILNAYCFHNNENFIKTKNIIKIIIASVSFKSRKLTPIDIYQWHDFSEKLLFSEGKDFAKDICHLLINEAENGFDYGDLWQYLQPLLAKVIRQYNDLWKLFGDAITSSEGEKTYWLLQLIGTNNYSNEKNVSVLSITPVNEIIKWCHENKDDKAFFIGKMINIFETIDGVKKPTALFVSLLENFGDDKKFGGELSANLGTGSWSGSRVPYLESNKLALEHLLKHKNSKVRSWVINEVSYIDERIKYELMKDEELKLGIY
jgi:hypothetical protein